jgi:hypothetical protein
MVCNVASCCLLHCGNNSLHEVGLQALPAAAAAREYIGIVAVGMNRLLVVQQQQ